MRTDYDLQNYEGRNVNMGGRQAGPNLSGNPFQTVINFVKGDYDSDKD